MSLPVVAAITCTRGRHTLLERCAGYFLSQDYTGKAYHIIFNNSPVAQDYILDPVKKNKFVYLVNQSVHSKTGKPYATLKEIFYDAMKHLPPDVEVINFFDDDDKFLPNHLSEGVKGYLEARKRGQVAYKPYYSYSQHSTNEGIQTMRTFNTFEPSIFVKKEHVFENGFYDHSAAYHRKWIEPLLDSDLLYMPEDGVSTLVYQWVGGVYHISGDGDNPENLNIHHKYNTDEGDGVITPVFENIVI